MAADSANQDQFFSKVREHELKLRMREDDIESKYKDVKRSSAYLTDFIEVVKKDRAEFLE